MNRYKKLAADSMIYILGNLGSKVVSLLMVSLYTYTLSTEEYGYVDVGQTTISLLLPLVTLGIYEAVFRYSLSSQNYSKQDVLSNGIFVTGALLLFTAPVSLLIFRIIGLQVNHWILLSVLVFDSLNELLGQFCRGMDKSKLYASTGIVSTFVIAIANVLFLSYFHLGILGYFLALLCGAVASTVIRFWGGEAYRYFCIRSINKQAVRYLLRYSIPLIPNSIMWWIMNAFDKYEIMLLLSPNENGLYAVAQKIPQIIYAFSSMFIQAWQISAVNSIAADDRNAFYSNVFGMLSSILWVLISGILLILKPFMRIYVSPSYYIAWRITPFLLISTLFSCFSAFWGSFYVATEKTKGASITVAFSAMANVILNYALINIIGVQGAALATALSFLLLWIVRLIDTRKYVNIHVDFRMMVSSAVVVSIEIVILNLLDGLLQYFLSSLCLGFLLLIHSKSIIKIWRAMKHE